MNGNAEQLITNFREELNKLKPAVQLVGEITTFSEDIQMKTLETWEKAVLAIDDLKKLSEKDLEKARGLLEDLHIQATKALSEIRELSEKSINDLHTRASEELGRNAEQARQAVREVEQKALDNLEEMRQQIERFMSELRATLEALVQRIEEVLEAKIDQLRERIEQLIQNLPGLLDRLANLIDVFERADLPGRLRRMEDALATLNTSVQNLHGRLDFLELNLREEHKKTQGMAEAIEERLKGLKTITVILLIVNLLLTIGTLIALFVKG